MIIQETIEYVKKYELEHIENLYISDVRMGAFLTAVKLSDDSCGVSSNSPNIGGNYAERERDFGDFTPNQIIGKSVLDLLDTPKIGGTTDTLKVAVLNAISSRMIENSDYKVLSETDPISLVDLSGEKTITIVGAFQSYIRKIAPTKNRLNVLELNEHALNAENKKYYVPAEDYPKVLPQSDVVIITGLTLVNHTLDNLLKSIGSNTQTIIAGPSGSLVPDVFFRSGVDIMGGVRITNPDLMFSVVGQGATGFHLFKYCAEKICVLNEKHS